MNEIRLMQRCLQLAGSALGQTYPNPMVGCVLTYQNRIIAQGLHHKAGAPHAEVNAIRQVTDPDVLANSTLFVSLEPCSHYGKTPPCTELVLSKGIKKIVVGTPDPFEKVAGKGIQRLTEQGCEVKVGVLQRECQWLNRRFITFHTKKRPYILLKWAQTPERFIAPLSKAQQRPVWITNQLSRQLVHKWRTQEQAILVGARTVLHDNPALTARDWVGTNPIRIVVDARRSTLHADWAVWSAGRAFLISGEDVGSSESENQSQARGMKFSDVQKQSRGGELKFSDGMNQSEKSLLNFSDGKNQREESLLKFSDGVNQSEKSPLKFSDGVNQNEKSLLKFSGRVNQVGKSLLKFSDGWKNIQIDFSQPIAPQICEALYAEGIQSVLIEGGRHTLQQFIDANLWDEARVFTGKSLFRDGIPAPDFPFLPNETQNIAGDTLSTYYNL